MIELDSTRCCEKIYHLERGWMRGHAQCERKWKVTRDGKHYCKQHDPEAVKKRKQLCNDKYDHETASHAMGWYGTALYDALKGLLEGDNAAVRAAKKILKDTRQYREILRKGKLR